MLNRHTLPPNTFLDGSYRIERVVGAGGFGITYEAFDVNLGTQVAIKEYFPHDFGDRDGTMSVRPRSEHSKELFNWGRTNFLHEARTLAGFDHPNIVRVQRVFEAHSTAYMVMRFERGNSLRAWLKELGRKPTQAEIDSIAAPLLNALELLHQANYLHRDVAPDNIIVRPDGTPVLLDFGSARRVVAEMSRMVTGIVKAGYSPHEQYASDNRLQGPWTDIYALGASLYFAVTGRQPIEAMLRLDQDAMEPAASAGGPDYRPSFLAAIDACLRVRPSERPQSIAQLRPQLFPPVSVPLPVSEPIKIPKTSPIAVAMRSGLTSVKSSLTSVRSAGVGAVSKARGAVKDSASNLHFAQYGAWLLATALVLLLVAGSVVIYQSLQGPATVRTSQTQSADSFSTTSTPSTTSEAQPQPWDDTPSRRQAEQEAERKRLADLETQRRQQAEKKRLADLEDQRRKSADEAERKRLAEIEAKRLKDEEEKKRLAEAEDQRRKTAEEAEKQRLARLEEQRRKAAEEAEKQRLAKLEEQRRKAAEEEERKRLADLDTQRRREAEDAERQRLVSLPSPEQLTFYVGRIEEILKKAACFEGLVDGRNEDLQTGLSRFAAGLQKQGIQKPGLIQLATATNGTIETWLKEAGELRVGACTAPVAPRPQAQPQQKPQVAPQPRPQRPPSYSAPRGPGTITGIQ